MSGTKDFIYNKLRNLMNILIIGGTSEIAQKILTNLNKNNNLKTKLFATYNDSNIFVKNVNYLKLDLTKENLFKRKINKFKKYKFNYVLFAAALTNASNQIKNQYCTFGDLKLKYFDLLLKVNCYSNLKLFEILHQQKMIKKGTKIIFFSSKAASIELRGKLKHNKQFGNVFYRISKSALNSAVKNIYFDFKDKYQVIALHPGHVKTKSGGKNALISADYSSKKIIKLMFKKKDSNNGKFLDLNGKIIKW